MTRRAAWRAAGRALAAGAALAGVVACSPAASAYFGSPDPVTITGSAAVGDRALIGVADLVASPGDRIELVAASPIDVRGSPRVSAWVIRRRDAGGGGIGFAADGDLSPEFDFETLARPLGSFAFAAADGPVEVVLGVESDEAGTVSFDGVHVSFRIGGTDRAEAFPTSATITFKSP